MYLLLRRLLFCFPPEFSHHLALKVLAMWYTPAKVAAAREKLAQKPVDVFGIKFPNPVGLAAGFDHFQSKTD